MGKSFHPDMSLVLLLLVCSCSFEDGLRLVKLRGESMQVHTCICSLITISDYRSEYLMCDPCQALACGNPYNNHTTHITLQAAADAKPSGMVSVIGLNSDKVAELCEVCVCAGHDRPHWRVSA
jgi:malonyl CoA-acyl carrier protein transacylase